VPVAPGHEPGSPGGPGFAGPADEADHPSDQRGDRLEVTAAAAG